MFVLICYDVPVHRTQTYKKCLHRFLERGQDSVFWGDLVRSKWLVLEKELKKKFEQGDSLWVFISENPHNVQEFLMEEDARGAPTLKIKAAMNKRSAVV